MTIPTINQPTYRIRERQRALGIATSAIEAVIDGERFPFVQAVATATHEDGRWLVMCGPEIARAANAGITFPPTFTVWSHDDAHKWVTLLAALHAKAVAP